MCLNGCGLLSRCWVNVSSEISYPTPFGVMAMRYSIGLYPGTPIVRSNAMNLALSPFAASRFVRFASIPPRSLMVSFSLPDADAASSENTSRSDVFPLPFAPITTLSGFSFRSTSYSEALNNEID